MPQLNPKLYREVQPGVFATIGAARLIRAYQLPVFPLENGRYWTCELVEDLLNEIAYAEPGADWHPGHPSHYGDK